MKIELSPQERDDRYTLEKQGDTLTINGISYDFSPLGPGDSLPYDAIDCEYIVGSVERTIDGVLEITLILPLSPDAPESKRFPEPLIDPSDGEIIL